MIRNIFKTVFLALGMVLIVSCNTTRGTEKLSDQDLKSRIDQLYANDQCKEAVYLLNQLIPQDSTNGELFFKRGACQMELLKFDSAASDFNRSIAYSYRLGDSYYNLALVQVGLYQDSLAITSLEKALLHNSDFPEAKQMLEELKEK